MTRIPLGITYHSVLFSLFYFIKISLLSHCWSLSLLKPCLVSGHIASANKLFRFVVREIHCGHNWLSENKLSVLCNASKGLVLCRVRMVNSPFSFVNTRCKSEQCKQIATIWQCTVLHGGWSKLYFRKK